MVGKRHASGEITAKLAQANELAAKGKTQREISKALGVSVMTYHRWKKLSNSGGDSDQLRRLVTDMLLDKLKLEAELRARQGAQMRRPSKG